MLSGFNTNYRSRGVLFHVQTEDSGKDNPHVITHLFHGGNIMSSEKQKYAEKLHLDGESLEIEVKALMEGQHKVMLKRLSRGEYDDIITARLGPDVYSSAAVADVTDRAEVDAPTPAPVETPPEPEAAQDSPNGTTRDRLARAFGDGVVSSKPLDEVVLDYLVENARKRKRSAK